jgi:hypothetical protein
MIKGRANNVIAFELCNLDRLNRYLAMLDSLELPCLQAIYEVFGTLKP